MRSSLCHASRAKENEPLFKSPAFRERGGRAKGNRCTAQFVIRANIRPPKFANAIAAIISGITAQNFPIFRDKHAAKFNAALAANFPGIIIISFQLPRAARLLAPLVTRLYAPSARAISDRSLSTCNPDTGWRREGAQKRANGNPARFLCSPWNEPGAFHDAISRDHSIRNENSRLH